MLSDIEASDDLESLNKTTEDIRAMQQRLETIILELVTLLRKQGKEVNTRNQQEITASEPDPKKNIIHDDNIISNQQQQPSVNFGLLHFSARWKLFYR